MNIYIKNKASILLYYKNLYNVYLHYFIERLFDDSIENVFRNKKTSNIDNLAFDFANYMFRLDKLGTKLDANVLAIFILTQISNNLGISFGDLEEDEKLYGLVQISKLLIDDLEGNITLSGLKYPISKPNLKDDIKDKDIESKVVVYPPIGYKVDVNKRWDGVTEYSLSLLDGYTTSRVEIDATNSSSDGTEILTLGNKNFVKRGLLSYKIKGDIRGEVLVRYWSVMFKDVLTYFKNNRRDEFLDIVSREILKGKQKVAVKFGSEGLTTPKHIGDNIYIEGHTSPNQIKSLLSILFIDLGLSLDDLELCVKKGESIKGKRRSL